MNTTTKKEVLFDSDLIDAIEFNHWITRYLTAPRWNILSSEEKLLMYNRLKRFAGLIRRRKADTQLTGQQTTQERTIFVMLEMYKSGRISVSHLIAELRGRRTQYEQFVFDPSY